MLPHLWDRGFAGFASGYGIVRKHQNTTKTQLAGGVCAVGALFDTNRQNCGTRTAKPSTLAELVLINLHDLRSPY